MHHSKYLSILSDLPHLLNALAEFLLFTLTKNCHDTRKFFTGGDSWIKNASFRNLCPGKQVTLAHLIAHPGEELAKKIGVPDAGAIGIMTLTPGETAMIAGDLALKAAGVHIGFLDRFSGALVIYGSVGAVEEALSQTVSGLGRLLNYTLCEMTKS